MCSATGAPPGRPPNPLLGRGSFETTPQCCSRPWGKRPSEGTRCSSPTGLTIPSKRRTTRCWTGLDCKCMIQHIINNKVKMPDILLCPDTYESAKGLTLGSYSPPLLVAAAELSGREVFPFLDASASPRLEAFLFFPPGRGVDFFFLLLLLIVFGGGVRLGVFGCHVRSTLATQTTSGPRGLLLGLLLRHLIRRRKQHLRQKRRFWIFGQRSRTVNLLRYLYLGLKNW